MCFESKGRLLKLLPPKKKIAKKNIPVWKIVMIEGSYFVTYVRTFPITDLLSINGYCFKADCLDEPEKIQGSWIIYHGIHSLKTKPRFVTLGCHCKEAYIPKGTAYYENNHEFVSEKIIFK